METIIKTIDRVSIVASGACNMHCDYCFLHHNQYMNILDKEASIALNSGKFIDNVINLFDKFNVDRNTLREVQFIGGETLLHTNEIKPNVSKFYSAFPSISNYCVITNLTTDMTEYASLLKEMDLNIKPNGIAFTSISVDGPESLTQLTGHKRSTEFYLKQFKTLIDNLNDYKVVNLKSFTFHTYSVLSLDAFIEYFSDDANIEEYLTWMDYFSNTIETYRNGNDKIKFYMAPPYIAIPNKFTVEDSIKCFDIYKKWDSISLKLYNQSDNKENLMMFMHPYFPIVTPYRTRKLDCATPCSGEFDNLIVLPDGSITDCYGNLFFGKKYEEICLANNEKKAYIESKLHKSVSVDPLKMSDEEFEEFNWYISGKKLNFLTSTNLTSALVSEMALSGQIPYQFYSDSDLNFVASLCGMRGGCARDNLKITNISELRYTGILKYFVNCVYPYSEQFETDPTDSILFELLEQAKWRSRGVRISKKYLAPEDNLK